MQTNEHVLKTWKQQCMTIHSKHIHISTYDGDDSRDDGGDSKSNDCYVVVCSLCGWSFSMCYAFNLFAVVCQHSVNGGVVCVWFIYIYIYNSSPHGEDSVLWFIYQINAIKE